MLQIVIRIFKEWSLYLIYHHIWKKHEGAEVSLHTYLTLQQV